jgi:hypothetical protein
MQSKTLLIESIVGINPSAGIEWLAAFEEPALRRYLAHLEHALKPRDGHSYWLRDAETTAVVTRAPAA